MIRLVWSKPSDCVTHNLFNTMDSLDSAVLICRGYMAPEYALWGYLTHKADVYSFGVVALEIVSGKSNNSFIPSDDCICLLDWVSPSTPSV